MIDMYKASLDCFKNKLTKGGYVFFKCQDMTDGKFYDTHIEIIKIAESYIILYGLHGAIGSSQAF